MTAKKKKRKKVKIDCKRCGKEFLIYPYRKGRAKYCSKTCHAYASFGENGYWAGKKRPGLKNTKASKTMFKKGDEPWNKGKPFEQVAGKSCHLYKHGKSKTSMYRNYYERKRRAKKYKNGGNHTIEEWQMLKNEHDYHCAICNLKEPDIKLSVDHIVPLSKGGTDNIENIQPLCISCNSRKGGGVYAAS